LSENNFQDLKENEEVKEMQIRFRTMGDITITGAVESDADSLEKIIGEVAAARNSERGERADDQRSDTAMEDRKKEGYF
jgi:sulfate adenylyltransferase subunit 2